jgi:hypothetical protein
MVVLLSSTRCGHGGLPNCWSFPAEARDPAVSLRDAENAEAALLPPD